MNDEGNFRADPLDLSSDQRGLHAVVVQTEDDQIHRLLAKPDKSFLSAAQLTTFHPCSSKASRKFGRTRSFPMHRTTLTLRLYTGHFLPEVLGLAPECRSALHCGLHVVSRTLLQPAVTRVRRDIPFHVNPELWSSHRTIPEWLQSASTVRFPSRNHLRFRARISPHARVSKRCGLLPQGMSSL